MNNLTQHCNIAVNKDLSVFIRTGKIKAEQLPSSTLRHDDGVRIYIAMDLLQIVVKMVQSLYDLFKYKNMYITIHVQLKYD